jgi:hypothetical protein
MNMNLKSVLSIMCLATGLAGYASDNVKFGKVSKEEINMTVYHKDSSASAVILHDYGGFNKNEFRFTRHIRIKVLKKAGTSWGNWVIKTPGTGDFKVLVFNKNGNEIEKVKALPSSIYKEEIVEGIYVYKVFAPNVKVGSVIDIKYSHFGLPYEWRFQHLIPVCHSELKIQDSEFIVYKKSYFGFEPINTVGVDHWVADDMPAFQVEPYLNDYSNYITKFEFQISRISFGTYQKHYSTTWEKVNNVLNESTYFGLLTSSMGFINEKAKEIKNAPISDEEKIHLAYNYVKEHIKWNGSNSLYASKSYRTNFQKNHSGNSAEINLILIGLLQKIGITTHPVALSTRDNGKLREFDASLNKLNYVVGYVKTDHIELFLDASLDHLVPGLLPEKCLNGKGWLVNKSGGLWVELKSKHKKKIKQYVQIAMNDDGFFEATVNETKYDYSYLDWVNVREEHNEEGAYLSYLRTVYPNLELLDYKVKKSNMEKLNTAEVVTVDMSNQVDDLGDEFIINPYLLTKIGNNPFKLPSRKYPVDLSSPIEESATIVMQIPQGYQVKTTPESIKLMGPGNVYFTFLSQQANGYLNISYKLQVDKSVFVESEYDVLRQFYSQIVNKLNESIYLQKKI